MSKRSTWRFRPVPMRSGWLRVGVPSTLLGILIATLILRGSSHAPRALATPVQQGANVQYFTAINLADPGFSSTATVRCPAGTVLLSGTHLTSAGASLVSEGASGNAWSVTAQGTGSAPVFFTAVAACITPPATPALQTIQGSMAGTATVVLHLATVPLPIDEGTQGVSLHVTFVGAPGYPWSIPDTGQLTLSLTVVSTVGTLTITLSGSGVGQYLPNTGALVENVTLHASSAVGSIDLPITLTTGTTSSGSITLTGSPVDAQGNITVVGVGTLQNGTGVVGSLLNGGTVAVTFGGTVSTFPTR